MPVADHGQFPGRYPGDVPGRLVRADVDPAGEHRHAVPAEGVGDLRVGPAGRAEVVVPAEPVGGAGHDRQQRPLGHPPGDRLRQFLGGLRGARAAAPLEGRHAVLADHQVGVVLVPGVQRRGGVQVGVPEPLGEPGCGGGQADTGAESLEQRLAFLPGQEVGAPVGVLPGAGDRDVAGAQFLGQVGEHHRLEVLPHHHAGAAAVGDRAPPVPRREGQARSVVLAVCGRRRQRDVVAPRGVIRAGVLQGGQHRVVAGGGDQAELGGQLEHHGAVLAEEPVHQHLVVVAVVGRHLLDVRQLGGEPAGLLDCGDRAGRSPARFPDGGLAIRVQVLQDGAVGADQPLRHRPLPQPDLLQLGLRLLEDGRDPLAQHLGQVVAGLHPGGVGQARHQGQLLAVPVPGQRVDVLGRGLPGEVGDLRRGDPFHPVGSVAEGVNLVQVLGLGLEPQPGRPLGRLLQPAEHRPAVRTRRVQQALRPLPALRAHPVGDAREDRLVDLSADGGRHVVQRGVRRELQRGLDDALQRHVDQVRRVVPHLRSLADRGRRQRPGPPRVTGRALPLAHQAAVQPHRPRRPVIRLDLRGQAEAVPHVIGDGVGDLLARAEPRHPLEALQVNQQRQQRLRRLGPLPSPRDLILRRREEHVQHPR